MMLATLLSLTTMMQNPLPFPFELDRVLDIENRAIVRCDKNPSDTSTFCDVLVVGGGLGGVAAAEAAARNGATVIIVEPTRMIGGQLTSQLVPVPDENAHIEKSPGPGTRSWRALRQDVREQCARMPGAKPNFANNIGQCWVSRVSAPPKVWEDALLRRLEPYRRDGKLKGLLTRHQIRQVGLHSGNGRFNWADIVDLDTGKVVRIAAKMAIDATEDGSLMKLAGMPLRIGQEARSEFDEPHAPDEARPDWVQSFTYCFLMQWTSETHPRTVLAPPDEYEVFKSFGEYTLDYVYRGQTPEPFSVPYKVLEPVNWNVNGQTRRYLPFWTYRRLVAASSFDGQLSPINDIALINWRGNDFHAESPIDKPLEEQVRILNRGRDFALGFAHWLQTECPRDNGPGQGWPEMQIMTSAQIDGVGADGIALHPYVRESRRLASQFTLTENHLLPESAESRWGTVFEDSVGCALYAIDIHPAASEPPLLQPAVPYHIPLGSFLTPDRASNILPGAKNIGATRLAAASTRMHPTEWLVGEVAGILAARTLALGIRTPASIRNDKNNLRDFQALLVENGITLHWADIIGR
jgi:hypothetical protein